jgi:hypothetical protein
MKNKLILWSNYNIHEELQADDWKEYINDCFPEYTDDESFQFQLASDNNWGYLDDLKRELKSIKTNTILLVGSLGLWNGTKEGYKIIDVNTLDKVIGEGVLDCEYVEYYIENNKFKVEGTHHDGTNVLTVRELKSNIDSDHLDELLFNRVMNGKSLDDNYLNNYTSNLGKTINENIFKGYTTNN